MSTVSLQQFDPSYSPFPPEPPVLERMQQSRTPGLDALAEGSQYALERLQSIRGKPAASNDESMHEDNDDVLLGSRESVSVAEGRSAIRKKSSSSTPVRRRISRACDQCNQLRTKCDGKNPCAHCIEFGLTCEYARARKKRGKASKKDIAAAAAAAVATTKTPSNGDDDVDGQNGVEATEQTSQNGLSSQEINRRYDTTMDATQNLDGPARSHLREPEMPGIVGMQSSQTVPQSTTHAQPAPMGTGMDGLQCALNDSSRSIPISDPRPMQMLNPSNTNPRSPVSMLPPNGFQYPENAYSLMNSHETNPASISRFGLGSTADHPPVPFLGLSPAPSPGWLPLPPPSPANFPLFNMPPSFSSSLRYSVLQPVLPHIVSIIPQSLACDLLDVYFTSSSSSHLSPQSPYVIGYIFRKQSFLHPTKPRACSPGLLASMLWVAAQTSDAAFLTSPPSSRGRVCQKLLELTIGLLRPLIHGPATGETSPNYAADMVINGVALGGFGVSMDQLGAQSSATGAVDDVATYVHLATVVSASEYKAASMRWWTAAWSLARELKLGRELPPNSSTSRQNGEEREGDAQVMGNGTGSCTVVDVTEEEREERRRIWWLLYATDRHLALCYNRPLTLLDKECEGLLQPMDDDLWQVGDFASASYRATGPPSECTGHSMFGYFLPLMTILGEIVDLQHARSHPRFGLAFRNSGQCETQVLEVTRQLDSYSRSLKEFEARYTSSLALGTEPEAQTMDTLDHVSPSCRSTSSAVGSRVNESIAHTKMVVAYGTHIMHVLHILLVGKWDPVNLLDDNDLWISSESFISALGHAVSAAEAAANILDLDPDLSFMPFFFGIYLLQGSFLLLLTADKLQGNASPSVVRACETIVRAHEACVVTLNTEYQRNFRKVMHSALAQVRGRMPEDVGEQQQRRRDVLALYRWAGDGAGLAL